jgi:uncharacterized membrane protein
MYSLHLLTTFAISAAKTCLRSSAAEEETAAEGAVAAVLAVGGIFNFFLKRMCGYKKILCFRERNLFAGQ